MNRKIFHPLEVIHPRSLKNLSYQLQALIKERLWLKILLGMFLGIIAGLLLGPSAGFIAPDTANIIGEWIAIPGYIFLALLQMIVVPLVFASIIRGIASGENMEQLRKMGLRTVAFFLATTAIAIIIGLGIATLVQPGMFLSGDILQSTMENSAYVTPQNEMDMPSLSDVQGLVGTLLPTNPLSALVTGQMLQVVMFSVIIGIALVSMAPASSKPLLELLGSVQEVTMTVVKWSMLLAPFAVFGLLTKFTINLGIDTLLGMTVYVGTVLAGLLIMMLIYLIIVFVLTKMNPMKFLQSVRDLLLLAFSTSSSAAVMPLSIKTAEEKLNVRPSVSQFVIPLGATINMNGTALYQSVAAVFLAQVFGVDLGIGELAIIMITVVGASIGTPATPGVGIVILAMILNSVGIPASGIALIIGVDRILDMSRTSVNVTGDIVACTVVDRWVGGEKTAEEERLESNLRERERRMKREDVVVNSHS
ncbi:Na+/H+-dicarboxylate symporter [Methanohalophilus levihalophilus]|nr:dicarboxylate/amino acid:cation symporter [Methanohalophilus levihalophilus]MBP2030230.1 Na+/H+-dicarboxylate symporter [Methanohalophilus levihalophilus]